jgi:hypothetical protein
MSVAAAHLGHDGVVRELIRAGAPLDATCDDHFLFCYLGALCEPFDARRRQSCWESTAGLVHARQVVGIDDV